MRNRALRLAATRAAALGAAACSSTVYAGDVRLDGRAFLWEGRRVMLKGVGYAPLAVGAQPSDAVSPCVYARDLPLIAAMGANTVRTWTALPAGDTTFVAVLGTTGLNWLAGFPLDPWYDPSRTLDSRRGEILAAFREYAARFRGEPRLIGFVFGDHVPEDYHTKFAGPVGDYYSLLAAASAVLQDLDAEARPLLAASTTRLTDLVLAPEGLDFWVWDAGARPSLTAALDEIQRTAAKPVLIGSFGGLGSIDEGVHAAAVVGLSREIFSSPFLLGGVYASFAGDYRTGAADGLFQPALSEVAGLDSMLPRAAYAVLAAEWEGGAPKAWQMAGPPALDMLFHAASGEATVAPGALVRFTGARLSPAAYAANGIPWPLHMGQMSVCLGGKPLPLAMVSGDGGSALVPWDSATGELPAILFRAGAATNLKTVQVRPYAPGIFEGAVLRAGSTCRVTESNGVRPGEVLEIYATGLGPGAPSWMTPSVTVNGAPAEVLYSGTLPALVGLNQGNVRLSPQTPPSANSALLLRSGDAQAPPYPLSVVKAEDRYAISLAAPLSEVVLQAGGPAKTVEIAAEGRNGYCGPVLLALAAAPAGVEFRAPVGSAGSTIPVELRASESAAAQSGATVQLAGGAPGVVGGVTALKVTVLSGIGDQRVRVVSGGYKSSPLARFDWNGRTIYSTTGGGSGRGINVLTVDPATGVFSTVRSFDTWGEEAASSSLVAFINALPAGTLAFFAVADDGALRLTTQARAVIASAFGSRSIEALGYQESWAMVGRKGAAEPIAEGRAAATQVVLERTLRFPMP
jgi:uncharacterized protein (TIGR03437 family)